MGPVKAIDPQRMRHNFSSHATEYDLYAAVQKRVVHHLTVQLQGFDLPAGILLDIGTGTGALAATLDQHGVKRPMLLMDIAHGMTCEARHRLPAAQACDGDARSLPFANDSIAIAASSSVYQWVDCLPSAFAEVSRVLQPGGLFAVALFGEKTLWELRHAHREAVSASGQTRRSHVQSFPTCEEVASALRNNGLQCHALISRMEVEHHADVPDLLRQLKHIGASNAAADRPKGLASRRVMQKMMALYEERHRCPEGVPASYEVVIAVAEKP